MYSLDNPEVKLFLADWFSGGIYQFGQYRNKHASKLEEYINFVKTSYLKGEPAFQSVQPMATIEKCFWEFDTKNEIESVNYNCPELDYIWIQTLNLCKKIEALGGKPLITYSGRRGYHVWVYTYKKIKYNKYNETHGRMLYKEMVFNMLGKKEDFPDVDTVPMHVNALARIPFSFHQKSGNQVLPLTKDRKPFIPKLQEYRENYIPKAFMESMAAIVEEKMKRIANSEDFGDWDIRKCVLKAFLTNVGHYANLALVLDAIYAGKSDKEIHELLSVGEGENYDYSKTQYQIDYQREKVAEGVKPPSMETLKRWGICYDCGECKRTKISPWLKREKNVEI